jgi:hypothetical protein
MDSTLCLVSALSEGETYAIVWRFFADSTCQLNSSHISEYMLGLHNVAKSQTRRATGVHAIVPQHQPPNDILYRKQNLSIPAHFNQHFPHGFTLTKKK